MSSTPGPPKKFLRSTFPTDVLITFVPCPISPLISSHRQRPVKSANYKTHYAYAVPSFLRPNILLGALFSRPPGGGPYCFHILETASTNMPHRRIC